jgi:hypothetical protein
VTRVAPAAACAVSRGRAALLALLILAAVPAAADPVADFWYWFEHEHEALVAPATRADREEALAYWLGRVDPALSYVLEPGKRRHALILSADGDSGQFRRVELMVDAAPKVKGWKFRALRPEARQLTPETVGDVTLDPATTHFDLYRDGARIGVVLYVPGYSASDNTASYRLAAMRLMSQAVGEWDVGMEIGFVDFDNQQVRDMQFSRPFAEFEGVFRKLSR